MTKPLLIIDPDHGGKDPGGGSSIFWDSNGFYERDIVLKISLYQYERFKELGVPVALTRNVDVHIDSTPRANLVKDSGAKYCISNHINAAGNASARGVETIHSIKSDGKLVNRIYDAIAKEGMPKRRVFTRTQSDGRDYYYMHRLTGSVSTVIIEYGFATNADDNELIKANWEIYAEAVVKAFCEHIGHKYTPSIGIPKDVSAWAHDGYKFVIEHDISDGKRPKDTITREEMWTMLERFHKINS